MSPSPALSRRQGRPRTVLGRAWAGPVTVLAGLALMLGTIASAPWLSMLGALATALGLGFSAVALKRQWALRAGELPAPRSTAR